MSDDDHALACLGRSDYLKALARIIKGFNRKKSVTILKFTSLCAKRSSRIGTGHQGIGFLVSEINGAMGCYVFQSETSRKIGT